MWTDFFNSLSLIDASGYLIIGVILLTLLIALIMNLTVRGRYAMIERDLRKHVKMNQPLRQRLLTGILRDAEGMFGAPAFDTNFQALIEHHIKREMRGALLAERFLKSAAGMLIVLGLVGTFYGLTLSIGKLVALITGDVSGISEITTSLTKGLAGALSGMSVAFSTSLVGIIAAIVVMLLGVFSNLGDKRNGLILELEVYLEEQYRKSKSKSLSLSEPADATMPLPLAGSRKLHAMDDLGVGVTELRNAVNTFESALNRFSENTRDFEEFNRHLKDNIQRMSLGFADLTETLKTQVRLMKADRPKER